MSTTTADLQFRQDQTPLRRIPPPLKIPSITLNDGQIPLQQNNNKADLIECRTPTSSEHRIPVILVCPPAPKKHNPATISCKRKLRELDFFEFVDREEIDRFFRTNELVNNSKSGLVKRKCARL